MGTMFHKNHRFFFPIPLFLTLMFLTLMTTPGQVPGHALGLAANGLLHIRPSHLQEADLSDSFGYVYDDTHNRFVYGGDWEQVTGIPGAYQSTLHVSRTVGDSVDFSVGMSCGYIF
jgi:hypothetical protein